MNENLGNEDEVEIKIKNQNQIQIQIRNWKKGEQAFTHLVMSAWHASEAAVVYLQYS